MFEADLEMDNEEEVGLLDEEFNWGEGEEGWLREGEQDEEEEEIKDTHFM